jgi:hypothetical protein
VDQITPAWLPSIIPSLPSGGILGSFPQPNDATDESSSAPPAGRGILGQLDRWSDPQNSNIGRGLLAPLERLASPAAATNVAQPVETSPFARFQPGYQPQQPGAPLTEGQPDDRRGILTRMMEGARGGAGSGELGISRENLEKYPAWRLLQIPAQMAETVPRTFGAAIGGMAGLGAGLTEHFGMSRADADRLQRDLDVAGTIAALLSGTPRPRFGGPSPAAGTAEFRRSTFTPDVGATPAATSMPAESTLGPQGTIGPRTRALTPLEEVRQTRYKGEFGTLREVDPTNPLLSALDTSKWFPQSWDVYKLNEELARLKKQNTTTFSPEVQRRLSALDNQHLLPTEFTPEFKSAGIDPEDYRMFMDAGWHRLLDKSPYDSQAQWRRFFDSQPNPTQEEVIKQLNAMMKQKPFIWSIP